MLKQTPSIVQMHADSLARARTHTHTRARARAHARTHTRAHTEVVCRVLSILPSVMVSGSATHWPINIFVVINDYLFNAAGKLLIRRMQLPVMWIMKLNKTSSNQ